MLISHPRVVLLEFSRGVKFLLLDFEVIHQAFAEHQGHCLETGQTRGSSPGAFKEVLKERQVAKTVQVVRFKRFDAAIRQYQDSIDRDSEELQKYLEQNAMGGDEGDLAAQEREVADIEEYRSRRATNRDGPGR